MKTLKVAIALLLFAGLASATPCSLGVSVQPEFPVSGQPVSIYYSAPYLGFIQTPSISIDGNQITIDQPTVHADPIALGDVPCGQRLVQAGTFQPGNYSVAIHLSTAAPMSGSFVVGPSTVTVCGIVGDDFRRPSKVGPDTGVSGVTVSTVRGSVILRFENRSFIEFEGNPIVGTPSIRVDGRRIVVTQTYTPFAPSPLSEIPPVPVYLRFCQSEDIEAGPLGAGSYTLVWTYLTPFSGLVSVSSSFNVDSGAVPSRGRAVRGH